MNTRTKKILFTLGFIFSPFYSYLMKFRAFCYRKGLIRTHKLAVPVISVGNLTMGGSGKTPLVIYLAEFLKRQGFKPAVISRGYRGTAANKVNIVSDGKTILLGSLSAGDEPFLIANTVSDIVVATGKKRIFPCKKVIDELGCDIIILDDGFQHLAIARDLDFVLFDTVFFAGNSRVFPGGDLREPVSALNRCDAFLLTGVTDENVDRAEKCITLLEKKFPRTPSFNICSIHTKAFKYSTIDNTFSKETITISELPEELICFCGIANHDRFEKSISRYPISIKAFIPYPDHHLYSSNDIESLCKKLKDHRAAGLLTTEKDITKLRNIKNMNVPIFTLPLEVQPDIRFGNFFADFLKKLQDTVPST